MPPEPNVPSSFSDRVQTTGGAAPSKGGSPPSAPGPPSALGSFGPPSPPPGPGAAGSSEEQLMMAAAARSAGSARRDTRMGRRYWTSARPFDSADFGERGRAELERPGSRGRGVRRGGFGTSET